jgi:uncharacterized membrane protein
MLFDLNEGLLAAIIFAFFLLCAQVGHHLGRRYESDALKMHIDSLQTAMLGLLALLMGFTFAMSVSRYDDRKSLVLAEANAIGTAYLRSDLLAPAIQAEVRAILREYVDARLAFYQAGEDEARIARADARAQDLQNRLWRLAADQSRVDGSSEMTALFITSLNDVIDLHEKRLRALENHVPMSVLYLVIVVAGVSVAFIGFNCGLRRERNTVSTAIVMLLFTFVLVIIVDLDRPRRGLITISQTSLESLRDSMTERPTKP